MRGTDPTTRQPAQRHILVPREGILPVYQPYLTAPQRRQIFFGGAGSGKSVFLATRALLDALTGRNTLIVRQVARTLRQSCFSEVLKAMGMFGLESAFAVSRGEMSLSCLLTGAQLLFLGLDDAEKIKSLTPRQGALTDVWARKPPSAATRTSSSWRSA